LTVIYPQLTFIQGLLKGERQSLRQGALTPDLNGDGKVDFKDFWILGENWSNP